MKKSMRHEIVSGYVVVTYGEGDPCERGETQAKTQCKPKSEEGVESKGKPGGEKGKVLDVGTEETEQSFARAYKRATRLRGQQDGTVSVGSLKNILNRKEGEMDPESFKKQLMQLEDEGKISLEVINNPGLFTEDQLDLMPRGSSDPKSKDFNTRFGFVFWEDIAP